MSTYLPTPYFHEKRKKNRWHIPNFPCIFLVYFFIYFKTKGYIYREAMCVCVCSNPKHTHLTNTIPARADRILLCCCIFTKPAPLEHHHPRSPKRVQAALEFLLCRFKYYSPPHSVSTFERVSRVRISHFFSTNSLMPPA